MEISNVHDTVFKVLVIKMLAKLGKRMDEQNDNLSKETEKNKKVTI